MSAPLVSIIIPSYNRADLLPRAVESVLRQTHANVEVIVVDDGSRDATGAYLASLAHEPRLVSYVHTTNHGQNAALNTGLVFAHGDYIGFCDSDDELLPTFVARFLERFEADPGLGAVYSRKFLKRGDEPMFVTREFTIEGHVYPQVLAQGFLSHMGTIMVKRECLKKTRLFDINFTNHQDDDFCFLIARHYKVGLIAEALAIEYNALLNNRVTDNRVDYALGFERLLNKHRDEIVRHAGQDALLKHLLASARNFLQVGDSVRATALLHEASQLFNRIVESGVAPVAAVADIVPGRAALRDELIALINFVNGVRA